MGLLDTVSFIVRHPLCRNRPLSSLARFAKWQIGSRLVPGPVAVEFVNGARLLAEPGMTGATGNIYVGLHEFEDMAFVLHFLRPDDLFVDVGANIGSYTVLAGAGAGARCISFEPDPASFAWLRRNIGVNGLEGRVDARRCAVGSSEGELSFSTGGDTVNHVLSDAEAQNPGKVQTVPQTTLDSALDGDCPAMLKIDVEGYETAVLRGAAATLAKPGLRCVIMEQLGGGARYGFDEGELWRNMQDQGFELFAYHPFERRLSPGEEGSGNNAIYVRDLAFVEERVRSAPPFEVQGLIL